MLPSVSNTLELLQKLREKENINEQREREAARKAAFARKRKKSVSAEILRLLSEELTKHEIDPQDIPFIVGACVEAQPNADDIRKKGLALLDASKVKADDSE